MAFVLATTSGVIFALLGDMFVIWEPTRKVGMIIQERILFSKYNFSDHTLRSWTELLSCVFAWYGSYVCFWPGDLLVAIQFGTFTGITVCVCGELAVEYIAEVEHRLIQGVSSRLALEYVHCAVAVDGCAKLFRFMSAIVCVFLLTAPRRIVHFSVFRTRSSLRLHISSLLKISSLRDLLATKSTG